MITESGKLIPFWGNRNLSNGEIKYAGAKYGTVGWKYVVFYPRESIRVNRNISYCHPRMKKAEM